MSCPSIKQKVGGLQIQSLLRNMVVVETIQGIVDDFQGASDWTLLLAFGSMQYGLRGW